MTKCKCGCGLDAITSEIPYEYKRPEVGPVRTVTRHEIVAGKYGNVTVWGDGWPSVKGVSNIDELTDAIATLTAIRDAMQANATA